LPESHGLDTRVSAVGELDYDYVRDVMSLCKAVLSIERMCQLAGVV